MAVNYTLTGKRRYRNEPRLFRAPLVVLQVEYHVHGYEPDAHGGGIDLDFLRWRDATTEDITEAARGA